MREFGFEFELDSELDFALNFESKLELDFELNFQLLSQLFLPVLAIGKCFWRVNVDARSITTGKIEKIPSK